MMGNDRAKPPGAAGRGIGVNAKLQGAFGAVAILTVIAAAVAIFSFSVTERGFERDAEFYRWRFVESPSQVQRAFLVVEDERPIAACALDVAQDLFFHVEIRPAFLGAMQTRRVQHFRQTGAVF